MADAAEVKIRLVFDGDAAKMAERLTADLKKAAEETKAINTAAGGVKQTAPSAFEKLGQSLKAAADPAANLKAGMGMLKTVGVGAAAGIAAAFGVTTAVVGYAAHAALEKAEKTKALTAQMISFSSNPNVGFGKAGDAARAYDRDFRKIAIEAGVTRDEVVSAFTAIGSQTGVYARLSAADSEKIAKNFAIVSREVPGGIAALTDGYEKLKDGQISSQSAIVQTITASGRLKGTAVDVARQLAYMAPVERLKVAEQALSELAKSSQFKPKGWEGLKTSAMELKDLAATSLGEPIINALLPKMEQGIAFLSAHSEDIENFMSGVGKSLAEAGDYVAEKFGWIYDNKDALAKTFKDVFGVIADTVKGAIEKFEKLQKLMGAQSENGGMSAGGFRDYAAESAASAGKIGGPKTSQKDFDAQAKRMSMMAEQFVQSGEMTNDEVDAMIAKFYAARDGAKAVTDGFDKAGKDISGAEFVSAYNQASRTHNTAAMEYGANILAGNARLQQALLTAGVEIDGGFTGIASILQSKAPEVANLLRGFAKQGIGTKPLQPQVNFNGNTFNIKQDFRDQDPDRIMLTFKSDILRSANARITSKNAQAFGP